MKEEDIQSKNNGQQEEHLCLVRVMSAFDSYKQYALLRNHKRRRDFMSLTESQKKLVPGFVAKLDSVDKCIETNMEFFRDLVENASLFLDSAKGSQQTSASDMIGQKHSKLTPMEVDQPPVSSGDMDKTLSTMRQFVRDWSKEGAHERKATYDPIILELNEIYKDVSVEERGKINVLVPGAGLGRLAFDIAKEGFSCQGNEFSYYMLFGSHFILNRVEKANQYDIFPFIHSFSNIKTDEKQLEPITIPDILPTNLPSTVDFSMVAGDFVEIYGQRESNFGAWDVIVTCYFIDTASNILEYLEVIHKALKKNGVWINTGPLLYHFDDVIAGKCSIELSLCQVKEAARKIGFEFKKESSVSTTYTSNLNGMSSYVYECATWTAVKL
ncbi:N2227-like protein-domain-containing protein [Sporodiniella umbellata]|nr:N2227-like protein-domain-containing protein [Sporodiniella umbellata]